MTRRIGVAQQAAFGCERVGVLIAGYEVPHMHVHVIPTNNMGQLSFANAASHVDPRLEPQRPRFAPTSDLSERRVRPDR